MSELEITKQKLKDCRKFNDQLHKDKVLILNAFYNLFGEQMSKIPEFLEALKKMEEVHIKKNEDYAYSENPFSNFDTSEYGLQMFPNPRDGAFAWPIFTKLARLSTLLRSNKKPNNESIEDTFIDIANYLLLWRADHIRRNLIIENIGTIPIEKSDLENAQRATFNPNEKQKDH